MTCFVIQSMGSIIIRALFGNFLFRCDWVLAHDGTYAFGSQKYIPGYSSASWPPFPVSLQCAPYGGYRDGCSICF
jgi:hypothetical protein